MRKKSKIIILGVLTVIILGGCKQDVKEKKAVSTPQPSYDVAAIEQQLKENREKAEAEEYVNCIDIQKIVDSIKINKKKVSFPIKLTDFGSNISLGEAQEIEQGGTGYKYSTSISDGKVSKAMVRFYSATGTKEDAQIYSFEADAAGGLNIQISGVSFGSSIDNVIAAIGEPINTIGSKDGEYRIYYENCQYEYLAFVFKNNKVSTISFCYLPKELR